MTKRRNNRRRSSRLERIERKCDRILSELVIIRQQIRYRPDIDTAIERMHKTARRMKEQCERERDFAQRIFSPKLPE